MNSKRTAFQGFSEEAYRFFWDIAFHNEASYYLENKERYLNTVKLPLLALAADLGYEASAIDKRLVTEPSKVISRLRRDTRYSKNKEPYRDHAWIGYKLPQLSTGESLSLYFEIGRTSYGYGLGMYCPNTVLMQEFRTRIEAEADSFLKLVSEEKFRKRFTVEGESYKKNRYPFKPQELQPWLNRKNFSFCFSSEELSNTMSHELVDEILEGFEMLKPVYQLLMKAT